MDNSVVLVANNQQVDELYIANRLNSQNKILKEHVFIFICHIGFWLLEYYSKFVDFSACVCDIKQPKSGGIVLSS